jgi:sarcosine/dimethylglycine N-methyltransferase
MDSGAAQAIYFYTRHPISSAIILSKLRAARGHLNAVTPDELFAHDQDHYGALAANDALAKAAQIGFTSRVADFAPDWVGLRAISPFAMAPTSPASS